MKTLKSILLSVAIIFATIAPFALVGRGGHGGYHGGGFHGGGYRHGGFHHGAGIGLGVAGLGLGIGLGARRGYYGPWSYRWNRPAWYYDSYWGPSFPFFSVRLGSYDSPYEINDYAALKQAYKDLQDRQESFDKAIQERDRVINTQSDQIDRLTEKLEQATSKTEKSSLANQLKEEQAKLLEAQQERKDLKKKLSVTKKDIKKLDQTAKEKLGTPPADDGDEE